MLAGKLTPQSQFGSDDHRAFNRHGEAFDRGETFSGVDYETGLQAVEELRALVPAGMTMAQFALRWILMFDAVTCAIPGAKRPAQVEDNVARRRSAAALRCNDAGSGPALQRAHPSAGASLLVNRSPEITKAPFLKLVFTAIFFFFLLWNGWVRVDLYCWIMFWARVPSGIYRSLHRVRDGPSRMRGIGGVRHRRPCARFFQVKACDPRRSTRLDFRDRCTARCCWISEMKSCAPQSSGAINELETQCRTLTDKVGADRLIELTCNPALTGFTLPKMLWVREFEPEIWQRVRTVLLPKDYVRLRLTGEKATDVADASGTLIFDVTHRKWSAEMLASGGNR